MSVYTPILCSLSHMLATVNTMYNVLSLFSFSVLLLGLAIVSHAICICMGQQLNYISMSVSGHHTCKFIPGHMLMYDWACNCLQLYAPSLGE